MAFSAVFVREEKNRRDEEGDNRADEVQVVMQNKHAMVDHGKTERGTEGHQVVDDPKGGLLFKGIQKRSQTAGDQ